MKRSKYAIILVSIFSIGFISSPMFSQAAASTKLDFNAMEYMDDGLVPPAPTIMFVEDGVLHIKDFWSMHLLAGTFGEDDISGWTQSFLHVKQDVITLDCVINGQTWFYIN